MKIILTGFEAFAGKAVNPSQMIVEKISCPANTELVKYILPVEFRATTKLLTELIAKEQPDVLLSLGQAGNVPNLAVERVAINMNNCRSLDGRSELPDSANEILIDSPIIEGAPNAYFSTLPVWELVKAVSEVGVECRASYSAGTYVCNHVMYVGCHLAEQNPGMISGFVHVPFLPEQLAAMADTTNKYSMELSDMVKGIQTIVNYLSGVK